MFVAWIQHVAKLSSNLSKGVRENGILQVINKPRANLFLLKIFCMLRITMMWNKSSTTIKNHVSYYPSSSMPSNSVGQATGWV